MSSYSILSMPDIDIRPDICVKETAEIQEFLEYPNGGPTDEEPPEKLSYDEDLISIDKFLGAYFPEKQTIKIYDFKIQLE